MIESEVRQFFETAQKPKLSVIDEIAAEVSVGIKLEQGIGHKTTKEVRDLMVKEIATTTFYASDFLGTPPWPSFGLIYEWGSEPPDKYRTRDRVVLANATVNHKHPEGLINFAPFYLEAIARFMDTPDYTALSFSNGDPLSKIAAHECYHVWQHFVFPKNIEKHTEVLFSAGSVNLSNWEKTRAERSARLFEDIFEGARNRLSVHQSISFATINED